MIVAPRLIICFTPSALSVSIATALPFLRAAVTSRRRCSSSTWRCAEPVHPPLAERRVPTARRDLSCLLGRDDPRHVQVPYAGAEEARDPLAIALGRARHYRIGNRPCQRR